MDLLNSEELFVCRLFALSRLMFGMFTALAFTLPHYQTTLCLQTLAYLTLDGSRLGRSQETSKHPRRPFGPREVLLWFLPINGAPDIILGGFFPVKISGA